MQEPTGVSLESGYSTDLSVPASAEEQQNYRTGEAVHRVQPAEEPIESAARRRRHRSEEREDCATTRKPERAWIFLEIVGDSKVSGERKPHVF